MLIHEIVEFCNNQFRNSDTDHICQDCTHPTKCSGNCKNCLEQIHYPTRYPNGKKDYDCENLINFYVCDYTNKYASEMLYLLRQSKKLKEIKEYHIISIGCGAAPDLMAFEQYVNETNQSHKISYCGIDVNPLWQNIHDRIKRYNSEIIKTKFKIKDATKYFNNHQIKDTNVIVLQYVISHFYNTGQISDIKRFFTDLVKNVIDNKVYKEPLIVLINDVNSCYRGRDFFEGLVRILKENKFKARYYPFYFDYRIQNEFQKFGDKHPRNNTLFDLDGIDLDIYEPWKECSSAQMLIEIY